MLIALLLGASVGAPVAPLHVGYSCDTQQEKFGDNVYSAASIKRTGNSGCARCPNANITNCFTSPSDVWKQLQPLPSGRRAISLEGFSPYYCETDKGVRYWQDKLSDGSVGPWGDIWAAEVKRRFTAWFAEYARIGGLVDYILSDFEMGGQAYWYAFSRQGGKPQDALVKDARWPSLLKQLDATGASWNVSLRNLSDMQEWTVHDVRASVWDVVVIDRNLAATLNASVYEPIAAQFPHCRLSNFAHAHHTDPTGKAGQPPAHDYGWPYATTSAKTPLGTGSHVGTHQSISVYGKPNTTRVFGRSTAHRVRTTAAAPFDALLWNVAKLRDMHTAAPGVPIQPWISPKYGTWNSAPRPPVWSWLSSSDGISERGDMWQENLLHAGVSTGATEFLWWKPGSNRPYNLGMELFSNVLSELSEAVATAGGAMPSGDCTGATPLAEATTAILAADDSYLLSGATLHCAGAGPAPRRIYRLTPRCLDAPGCASRPRALTEPRTRATLKLFSGFEVVPVADGCWWAPSTNTSAAGFWIVAPC